MFLFCCAGDSNSRLGHRMTWTAYHRSTDIMDYLDYLAATYPDLCSVLTIGHTIEHRPLKMLRIANGAAGNSAVWIDGGLHAREWVSPASVTFIIAQFVEDWEKQPVFVRSIDWFFLPLANPDGYEYSHTTDRLWRKNRNAGTTGRCIGVDLNRNYGYHWGDKGSSHLPCDEAFVGAMPFSERETSAQQQFMQTFTGKFRAAITFHSYGQYIVYPWGYDRLLASDDKDLDRVGKEAAQNLRKTTGKKYRVGPSSFLLYRTPGVSHDWFKSLGIKYAYSVELGDTGRYGFVLPADHIQVTAADAIQIVISVAQAI